MTFIVERASTRQRLFVRVAPGTPLRRAIRLAGLAPEGCAVLHGGNSLPLDTPIDRPSRFQLVPTFSGG